MTISYSFVLIEHMNRVQYAVSGTGHIPSLSVPQHPSQILVTSRTFMLYACMVAGGRVRESTGEKQARGSRTHSFTDDLPAKQLP